METVLSMGFAHYVHLDGKKMGLATALNCSKKKVDVYLDICRMGQRDGERSESHPLDFQTLDVRSSDVLL